MQGIIAFDDTQHALRPKSDLAKSEGSVNLGLFRRTNIVEETSRYGFFPQPFFETMHAQGQSQRILEYATAANAT